jgi:hypothetical protein
LIAADRTPFRPVPMRPSGHAIRSLQNAQPRTKRPLPLRLRPQNQTLLRTEARTLRRPARPRPHRLARPASSTRSRRPVRPRAGPPLGRAHGPARRGLLAAGHAPAADRPRPPTPARIDRARRPRLGPGRANRRPQTNRHPQQRARLANAIVHLRDPGRINRRQAAYVLLDLSTKSPRFIAASLLEAVAVSVGVSRTPGGLHIAA